MSLPFSLTPEMALFFVIGFLLASLVWLFGPQRGKAQAKWFAGTCLCMAGVAMTFRLGLGGGWTGAAGVAAVACYVCGVLAGHKRAR